MPSLYDSHRRRVGSLPQLASSGFVVPQLTIWPEAEAEDTLEPVLILPVRVSAMIPVFGEGYTARQVAKTIPASALPEIVAAYRANPEEFLETFFNIKLNPRDVLPATKIRPAPTPSSRDVGI